MATKLQIWNRAARYAGETQRIESVDDDTSVVAAVLADTYDDFVREVLGYKEWPWARVQAALSPVAETRVGWEFVYALPTDCVRPLALLNEGERRATIPQKQRLPFDVLPNDALNAYVLCTEDDGFEVLEYIAHIAEPALYPAHFTEALVRRLAAHLLDAVKKAPGEAMAMLQRYEDAVADAVAVANNSAGQPAFVESPALAARR